MKEAVTPVRLNPRDMKEKEGIRPQTVLACKRNVDDLPVNVYIFLLTHTFIRYVVELGNNGKIQSYYPLEEEIYATQWIGGVIVLSARRKLEPIMPEKNFKTFLAQATRTNTKIQEMLCMAYCNFDIVREEFVPQSHIIRL